MRRIVGPVLSLVVTLWAGCQGQILAPRVGDALFFSVGGTVTGLVAGENVVLQNNSGDTLTVGANGGFTFPTLIREGSTYSVSVLSNPAGQTCAPTSNASGVVAGSVTTVVVTCSGGGGDGGASGDLDTTYGGGDGFTVHDGAAGGSGLDLATSMTRDASGRILLAGGSANPDGTLSMVLYRYTAAGVLDTTFNSTGFVTHAGGVGTGGSAEAVGTDVMIDAAGRYVVVGYSIPPDGSSSGVVIWRYDTSGTLDPSLGAGAGFIREASVYAGGTGGALDTNGRILVTGYLWNGTNTDLAIWRFQENGTLDPLWNGTGVFSHDAAGGGNSDDTGLALLVDSTGRVLATGYTTGAGGDVNSGQDMAVWRLAENGTLDTSFNGSGFRVSNATGGLLNDSGRALLIDSMGRILVTGNGGSTSPSDLSGDDLLLWRLTSNGALDTTFNGTGLVRHDGAAGGSGRDEGRAVVIDDTGRIVVAGISTTTAPDADIALWRFSQAGVLDTTFNDTGFVTFGGLAGGTNASDQGRDLRVDATGNYLVAGTSTNASGNFDVVTLRVRSN